MQALKSPSIRGIWYIIWLALVIFSQKLEQLCLGNKGLNPLMAVIFVVLSGLILFFMWARYQHEQQCFNSPTNSLHQGITEFFGLIAFAIIAIGLFMMLISYLKAMGRFPYLINRADYLDRGSIAFWFDLLATSLVIAIEQQFVTTGFFFNYFLRRNSLGSALAGIFLSGLIYGLLNLEVLHWINFFIYMAIGWMLATIYLSTQNFRICVMMAVFIAILKVILI
ncbi:hypothetical protein DS831_01215 [Bombilactobacillus bombi]|uniref:CAAX prenyl protease 2/Lysostaphin resistance protein A-like domain-containing protein n=1 Tax=Bombilactobacillus bombi TaxID=1303590 RepID=A0A3R6VLA3_9LACO|nr:CPBP family glutamic-type intramembrane protease [Bombilactobacillus bombi]RHW51979.1 hypothetical protein DS831_01215 [Bombilactobacillus bombi]